jgi:hypothetical protein
VIVTALAVAFILRWWWPIDGAVDNIRLLFCKHGTVWAPGYTDEKFQAVRVGMRRDEVYSLLGPPLEKVGGGTGSQIENWSSPKKGDDSYRVRTIIFYEGRVERKRSHIFFYD